MVRFCQLRSHWSDITQSYWPNVQPCSGEVLYSRGAIFFRFCYTSFPLVQCYPILLVQWFFHPSYWSSDFPPFLTVNVCSFRPIGPTFFCFFLPIHSTFVPPILLVQHFLFLPSYWSRNCSFFLLVKCFLFPFLSFYPARYPANLMKDR